MGHLQLAIESSGFSGSVALMDRQQPLVTRELPEQLSSVQAMAATLAEILRSNSHATPHQPQMISVTTGPGSFTGLRVGVTTAKMLAYAWTIPIAPIDSLEVVAAKFAFAMQSIDPQHDKLSTDESELLARWHGEKRLGTAAKHQIVIPVINAFRRQVFSAAYRVSGEELQVVAPSQVVDAQAWRHDPLASLKLTDSDEGRHGSIDLQEATVFVSGPGLSSNPLDASRGGARPTLVAPPSWWVPTADFVGRLGWHQWLNGTVRSSEEVFANYIRPSAAEEAATRPRP